ncbi:MULTISPECIES: fimbria/pilus chaperone family protein [Pseudomonas]|uniref:fimbria/pilus chaperone family protein n=1 Tax=Pseudomonas TaxID=286 RepID=UPI002AB5C3EE|nr:MULTISPECIES: fimbria/pilus chaperone family protein [unclassified Pseudomonas]MDY7584360.1 fimbria/pilus chaperone family protein [Pseudomonas sp. CCI3.1]MEB0065548.1 fimbria/pilus chaperone family protein [Pseudomonas sp. CCI3.1]MEB0071156.1 fimbria/pilus chaperone family protein [Pseudomonas sp. CCI1.4]
MKFTMLYSLGWTLFVSSLIVTGAHAAGMIPETSVVILNEVNGEATINIKNSDSRPALLYSQILPVENDDENLIVLTPPVARVDPGETQAIRFLLQTTEPLKVQRLRRVVFEGIPPKDDSAGVRVNMNVRQNLPVIIHPKGLAMDKEPWRRLKWSIQNSKLQVTNPDAYVVRLDQAITLMPSNSIVQLPRSYLLPGEVVTLDVPSDTLNTLKDIILSPATVYGYTVDKYTAPVSR